MIFLAGLEAIQKFIPGDGGNLAGMFGAFIWMFLILVVVAMVIFGIRQAVTYKYRGELTLRRQEDWESSAPTGKTLSGRAGYVSVKGRKVFRI